MDNLLLAVPAPAVAHPIATTTNRREEPVQTTPEPIGETIRLGHFRSVDLLEILKGTHQP